MKDIIRVPVMEEINTENDRVSDRIRADFDRRGIFAVNVLGAPGVGKTTSLLNLAEQLQGEPVKVIEGDIESDIDTRKLEERGVQAQQINTQGACHLDAWVIEKAAEALELSQGAWLFVENVGNLVCPAEFNIGEHLKLLIVTVTEGSDKPYKYPLAFEKADLVLLNKCDLIPYVDFDEAFFTRGLRAVNPHAPLFPVSGRNKTGYDAVADWLRGRRSGRK
jgi:hydrogenase nickel incorporation protein HypB